MISHEAEQDSGQIRKIDWHGTPDEALSLLSALKAHCDCKVDSGKILFSCPGHYMLARDQGAVDGLLRMRRKAEELATAEFEGDIPSGFIIHRENIIDRPPVITPKQVLDMFKTPPIT